MRRWLEAVPGHRRWRFWIGAALLIKGAYFLWQLDMPRKPNTRYPGTFAQQAGDSASYLEPIEQLLASGEYADDYRMPGYGLPYLLLRLLFRQDLALDLLIVLQLLLSAVSVYALALVARRATGDERAFGLAFLVYAVSNYVSLFDTILLTESFCASALVIATWLVLRGGRWSLLLAGALLAWAVFLRPVYLPLLGILGLFALLRGAAAWRRPATWNWLGAALLALPFVLADGAWAARNHARHGGFHPLTRTMYAPSFQDSFMAPLFRYMQAFGASLVYWHPGNAITWFIPDHLDHPSLAAKSLPERAFTAACGPASADSLRASIRVLLDDTARTPARAALEADVIARLNRCEAAVRAEKPFLYHVGSRLLLLGSHLAHSGTYNLFPKPRHELEPWQWAVKAFFSLLYAAVVALGMAGIVLLARRPGGGAALLLAAIACYAAFIHPLVLKLDEFRYFVPAYPFFAAAASAAVIRLFPLLKRAKA